MIVFCLLAPLPGLSAGESSLAVPRDRIGKPLLFGSRVISVNEAHGKVFAGGQRAPRPVLVQFEQISSDTLLLRPLDYHTPDGMRLHHFGKPMRDVAFPILRALDDTLVIDISDYFSSYPEIVSAVPPKMLDGRAVSHEILETREMGEYLQVAGRYAYASGLEVTANCFFLYLKETPMPVRQVDPAKAGYMRVEYRDRHRHRAGIPIRWDLSGGRTLDFYVDRGFPAAWYPYIKEGIEDWNRAFEAIGLPGVLRVHPEPEDGSLDRNSPLVNMVRYMDVDVANAKGDVLYDPRSGEVLQGDILWWRDVLKLLYDWRYVQTGAADAQARLQDYPLEMLGPMIRHAVCHEMGHVLGLSHNMGASYSYPADSLQSPGFTQVYGTCASVMDYARYNHLATAEDIAAGVNLLPPRVGPYDFYAIALAYGTDEPEEGLYCYFAPLISAAISPDPSSQAETLGDDLLRSSAAGIRNCRALLQLDGLDPRRLEVIRRCYYHYIFLTLSNIGGTVRGEYVGRKTGDRTLAFVMESLSSVPPEIADEKWESRILGELTGNFLPERVKKEGGEKELRHYYHSLRKLNNKYPNLSIHL